MNRRAIGLLVPVAFLLGLTAFAAQAAGVPEPPAPPPDGPAVSLTPAQKMRFAWPTPISAQVEVREGFNGPCSLRYTIELRDDGAGGYILSARDPQPLSGKLAQWTEATSEAGRRALCMPLTVRLDHSGRFFGYVDEDARLKEAMAGQHYIAGAETVMPERRRDLVRQELESRTMQTLNAWFGAWDGAPRDVAGSIRRRASAPEPWPVQVDWEITHVGTPKNLSGTEFWAYGELTDAARAKYLLRTEKVGADAWVPGAATPEDWYPDLVGLTHAYLDVTTMRPLHVESVLYKRVSSASKPSADRAIARELIFDFTWSDGLKASGSYPAPKALSAS